jgi:hypothetical protein
MGEPDTNDETGTWQEFRDDDADPVRVEGFPLPYVEEASVCTQLVLSSIPMNDSMCG